MDNAQNTERLAAERLEQLHKAANVPPYSVRKQLREQTLKVGR